MNSLNSPAINSPAPITANHLLMAISFLAAIYFLAILLVLKLNFFLDSCTQFILCPYSLLPHTVAWVLSPVFSQFSQTHLCSCLCFQWCLKHGCLYASGKTFSFICIVIASVKHYEMLFFLNPIFLTEENLWWWRVCLVLLICLKAYFIYLLFIF